MNGRKSVFGLAVIVIIGLGVFLVAMVRSRSVNPSAPPQVAASTSAPVSSAKPHSTSTPTPNPFELTRENILPLMRTRMSKPVTAVMNRGTMPGWASAPLYKRMWERKIIVCEPGMYGCCDNCKPGPNGQQLEWNDYTYNLDLIIGRMVPSVTGVSRTDQTSGLVDVVLNFEANKNIGFYNDWQEAFNGVDLSGERHTVRVRLYDNGWRIEKID